MLNASWIIRYIEYAKYKNRYPFGVQLGFALKNLMISLKTCMVHVGVRALRMAQNCFWEHSNLIKIYVSPVAAIWFERRKTLNIIVILNVYVSILCGKPTELKWFWPFRCEDTIIVSDDSIWTCWLSIGINNQHALFNRMKHTAFNHCCERTRDERLARHTGLSIVLLHSDACNDYEIES